MFLEEKNTLKHSSHGSLGSGTHPPELRVKDRLALVLHPKSAEKRIHHIHADLRITEPQHVYPADELHVQQKRKILRIASSPPIKSHRDKKRQMIKKFVIKLLSNIQYKPNVQGYILAVGLAQNKKKINFMGGSDSKYEEISKIDSD